MTTQEATRGPKRKLLQTPAADDIPTVRLGAIQTRGRTARECCGHAKDLEQEKKKNAKLNQTIAELKQMQKAENTKLRRAQRKNHKVRTPLDATESLF
jgi:septal ring factor EnvC (AmiA/AmiB activator)